MMLKSRLAASAHPSRGKIFREYNFKKYRMYRKKMGCFPAQHAETIENSYVSERVFMKVSG